MISPCGTDVCVGGKVDAIVAEGKVGAIVAEGVDVSSTTGPGQQPERAKPKIETKIHRDRCFAFISPPCEAQFYWICHTSAIDSLLHKASA
jgi:hypothetical protein